MLKEPSKGKSMKHSIGLLFSLFDSSIFYNLVLYGCKVNVHTEMRLIGIRTFAYGGCIEINESWGGKGWKHSLHSRTFLLTIYTSDSHYLFSFLHSSFHSTFTFIDTCVPFVITIRKKAQQFQ